MNNAADAQKSLSSSIAARLRSAALRVRSEADRAKALQVSESMGPQRAELLAFLQHCWWSAEPLRIGMHTRAICQRIDRAIADFENGISSRLIIKVPFRHGKSEIVSRALPAYFLGRCAAKRPDVIVASYAATLSESFSRRAKAIIQSPSYTQVFPHVRVSTEKNSQSLWQVDHRNREGEEWFPSTGEAKFVGLSGSLTGAGYMLGVVDDYCSNREEAESSAYRDATWNFFSDSFLTRAAPVSITIITATPWHDDDIIGRIRKRMDSDPHFPRFETLSFPARGPAIIDGERVPYASEFLFPERFSNSWYLGNYASLGSYSASGLLDTEPRRRHGNLFRLDSLRYHQSLSDFPATRFVRFWDLASTKKELAKDDPDFTVGALVGVTRERDQLGQTVAHVWLKDLIAGQWNAPERDRRIREAAERDGQEVRQLIEQVAGYKDAVESLKLILRGVRRVQGVTPHGDKMVRAAPLEPIMEAGNVHVLRAPWNQIFETQFGEFPTGGHDDVVDAVSGAFRFLDTQVPQAPIGARRALGV